MSHRTIALGILQLVALECSDKIKPGGFRYLRTPSKGIASEATIAHYLRKNIFANRQKKYDLKKSSYDFRHVDSFLS